MIGIRGVPARYSGFETCAQQLGTRMVQRGHSVTVFCRSGHYPERPRELDGIRLVHLPAVPGKHVETLSHTALAAIAARNHDAIVCFGVGNAPVVRALVAAGRRVILNVDGADWQRAKWGGVASAYLRRAERLAARSTAALVADALAVQRYYTEVHGRQTHLIPYGAEPPADSGTETLARFGLRSGGYVLFVGRLEPENAAHDFLAGAAAANLGVPLVVVGDATYGRGYVERLRAGAPQGAVFTGYQFGAPYQQLTAHAGVFVLAATVGGTHPVLLEQMAAGNAILARDTEANREVLGGTGLLWDTTTELAAQLRDLWPNAARRRQLGESARAHQVATYNWEAVTDAYLRLCADPGPRR